MAADIQERAMVMIGEVSPDLDVVEQELLRTQAGHTTDSK